MRITNHYNLPESVVRAVENDPYRRGECDYTVTELISPPRQRRLKAIHAEKIEEDASERIWALLGQSVHVILERADIGMAEERMYMDIGGARISGQYDTLSLEDDTLSDYKLTSVWSVIDAPKPEWVSQLNYLALLAAKNGLDVKHIEVVAFLRDWSKPRARREESYPRVGVTVLSVPMWPMGNTIEHMKDAIERHEDARLNLPFCTPSERWDRPTVYAVRKKGRKSAVAGGLHADMGSAIQHAERIPGGYVETRQGESVRCAEYCSVAQFCEQYQGIAS